MLDGSRHLYRGTDPRVRQRGRVLEKLPLVRALELYLRGVGGCSGSCQQRTESDTFPDPVTHPETTRNIACTFQHGLDLPRRRFEQIAESELAGTRNTALNPQCPSLEGEFRLAKVVSYEEQIPVRQLAWNLAQRKEIDSAPPTHRMQGPASNGRG